MKLAKSFFRLPYLIRLVTINFVAIWKGFGRYGSEYSKMVKFLNISEDWLVDTKKKWQEEALGEIMTSAINGSQYYSNIIKPEFYNLSDFNDFMPILEKNTLKTYPKKIINFNEKKWATTYKSGSTGSPMVFEHSKAGNQKRFAVMSDHLTRLGVKLSDRSVRLSGRIIADPSKPQKKPWIHNFFEKQLLLSTYHLDEFHGDAIGKKLLAFQPAVIDGYPSSILQLLTILNRINCKIPSLRLIVCTAETLSPETLNNLKELARVPVVDYYSASEGTPLVQQCEYGTYHVRWQSGFLQVRTADKVASEGDGEIIATSLFQRRMPLLKYATGDLCTGLRAIGRKQCQCGLVTQTIESVLGRIEDQVKTEDGRQLGMFPYRTLKQIQGIAAAQIIQEDYRVFLVKIVFQYPVMRQRVESDIRDSFKNVLGYEVEVRFEERSEISKGANGKVRSLISYVS